MKASIEDEAFEEAIATNAPPGVQQPAPERKLIRNGSISFEVSDVLATRRQITELTKSLGGYISSEKQNDNDDNPTYHQVIRVPGASVDDFVTKVESFATKIESKDMAAQDVTEEYVDVESRLIAKKAVEARYLEIIKQARTIKDILEVENEIGLVRSEIESMQGRLKHMSNKIAFATIDLIYYEPDGVVTPPGAGSKFAESFMGGWHALIVFLVALTATWPFMIIIGAIALLYIRRSKRQPKQVLQQ